jgi:HPt (histidine-containing phosphotransfer) domain-containing protein
VSEPWLSPAQLEEIRALAQVRPDFREQVLVLFEDAATEALEGCLGAWLGGDTDQLQSFAHRLKGTAASIGALKLRSQAEKLETDAGNEARVERYQLDELEQSIDATCRAYAEWLQGVCDSTS